MAKKREKMGYEKPGLVDFLAKEAAGQDCLEGSGNPDYCGNGQAASGCGCSEGAGVIPYQPNG